MESFREMYERCYMQREDKLNQLKVRHFFIFLVDKCSDKKTRILKAIFTSADLDQFLAGQGEELLQSGEGETPRDKDGLRWHCSKSTQIGSESAGGYEFTWVYLILHWLKVSTFSFSGEEWHLCCHRIVPGISPKVPIVNLFVNGHAQTPMDSEKSEFAQISFYITIHTDISQTSVSIGKVDEIGKIWSQIWVFLHL